VVAGVYEKAVDRESAFELLAARAQAAAAATEKPAGRAARTAPAPAQRGGLEELLFGSVGPRGGKRDGLLDLVAKSAARSTGTAISRGLVRGVLGSLLGGRRR